MAAASLAVDTALDSERRPGKGGIRVERGEGTNRLERGKSSGLGMVPRCLARSCILVTRRSPSVGQFVYDCLSICQPTSVYPISVSVCRFWAFCIYLHTCPYLCTTGSVPRDCVAAFQGKDLKHCNRGAHQSRLPTNRRTAVGAKIQTQRASRSTRFPQPWRLALAGSVGEMNGSIAAGARDADDAGKPGVPEHGARASKRRQGQGVPRPCCWGPG